LGKGQKVENGGVTELIRKLPEPAYIKRHGGQLERAVEVGQFWLSRFACS
jgi:hypothetical protein